MQKENKDWRKCLCVGTYIRYVSFFFNPPQAIRYGTVPYRIVPYRSEIVLKYKCICISAIPNIFYSTVPGTGTDRYRSIRYLRYNQFRSFVCESNMYVRTFCIELYTFFVPKYLNFFSTEDLIVATYNTLCFERRWIDWWRLECLIPGSF